jgi:hypothetical protein
MVGAFGSLSKAFFEYLPAQFIGALLTPCDLGIGIATSFSLTGVPNASQVDGKSAKRASGKCPQHPPPTGPGRKEPGEVVEALPVHGRFSTLN